MHDDEAANATSVVEVHALSRRFGSTLALDGVSLTIPRGVVFGLVGANGAGKTTLIRHVMGTLRAEQGSVSVFGIDPVEHPSAVLSRIGYLSEINDLPEWMRVHELLRFTRAFYPSWDESYAESLRRMFELDVGKRVADLSRGQRARLALLLALAHRAQLLVLDEPSTGLDPLVRRDILRAIIKTISDEGRTVLFSSHLLDEVERVADQVAIIEQGRIIENEPLETLKAAFQRVLIQFERARTHPPETAEGLFGWQGEGDVWSALHRGGAQEAERVAARMRARLLECQPLSLDELFVALVGREPAREEEQA